MEDDDNVKGEETETRALNEKEKFVLELLKDVEEYKCEPRSWLNKIPAKNQFLKPINEESKSIKGDKNDIVNNLAGKCPRKIFE